MPSGSEVLGDRTIGRQEALRMTCGLKPLHTALALTCRPMGVLTPIIEIAALTVFYARENLALRRAIAFEFIGDDHAWDVEHAFEELAEELLGRVLIASALHENVEDVVVLIDGPPQVMPLTIDCQEDLVQMPFVARLRTPPSQPLGVVLPKLPTPFADGFVGHRDATFEQELFHIAVAQSEAIVEPDSVADDFSWKAVVFLTVGVASGWHGWRPIQGSNAPSK